MFHSLSRKRHSFSTSLRRALLSLLDLIVGRQRTIKQPALVYFRNISDEDFIPSLKYLMENNPIGLPVLVIIANQRCLSLSKSLAYLQTLMNWDGHAV